MSKYKVGDKVVSLINIGCRGDIKHVLFGLGGITYYGVDWSHVDWIDYNVEPEFVIQLDKYYYRDNQLSKIGI